eukprot:SAG22_NODE_147_length_17533_cov_46.384536_6_plen_207_part_00
MYARTRTWPYELVDLLNLVVLYSCTAVQLYSCTAVQLYSCTAVLSTSRRSRRRSLPPSPASPATPSSAGRTNPPAWSNRRWCTGWRCRGPISSARCSIHFALPVTTRAAASFSPAPPLCLCALATFPFSPAPVFLYPRLTAHSHAPLLLLSPAPTLCSLCVSLLRPILPSPSLSCLPSPSPLLLLLIAFLLSLGSPLLLSSGLSLL